MKSLLDSVIERTVKKRIFGVRYSVIITAPGRQFFIENAVIWNVVDSNGHYCGQAAAIGLFD